MDIDEDLWERLSPKNYEYKTYLTNITILRLPNYGEQSELGSTSLVIYGLDEGKGKRFALKKISRTTWVYSGCIELSSTENIEIILNSDEIGDVGYLPFTRAHLSGLALDTLGSRVDVSQEMFNVKGLPKPMLSTSVYILPSNKIENQPQDNWNEIFEHTGFQAELIQCQDISKALCRHSRRLRKRFECKGDVHDISRAIASQEKAIQLTPKRNSKMHALLNNLGVLLSNRFVRTGNIRDNADATAAHWKAFQLTPEGHPHMPSQLNNLSSLFSQRYKRTGDLSDLSVAICILQKAVQITPDDRSNLPTQLSNLGSLLSQRFKHTGDFSDISEAISVCRKAIQLTPDAHSDMPFCLNCLGNSLKQRFERTGELSDISEAISVHLKAVHLTPDGHSDMPSQLNNLGNSLKQRFEHTGDLSDISEAISVRQKAVHLVPAGHSDIPIEFINLGNVYIARYQKNHQAIDLENACSQYQLGATSLTGSPSIRLRCARLWAICCKPFDSSKSLNAFEIAIQLVSQVAGMEQTLDTRHRNLQDQSNLSLDAAATAFLLERPDKALEWLEQGRCLVWSQLNNLRTPLDALRNHNPTLADRVLDVSRLLETASSRSGSSLAIESSMSKKIIFEQEAHSHIKLANEWERLLKNVRDLPEFGDFLKPSPCSTLLEQLPPTGPIVVINIHKKRCDALVLIADLGEPLHIPLPDFSYQRADELRDQLQKTLTSRRLRMRGDEAKGGADRAGRPIHNGKESVPMQQILRTLWLLVVKPILDGMGYSSPPTNSTRLRIWWCATGPLAFLPLHAAGLYESEAGPESNISAFAVSSYTPTVTSLIRRFKTQRKSDDAHLGVFMAAVPDAPGLSPIPETMTEVRAIERQLSDSGIRSLCLDGKSATVDLAMESMNTYSCVHFACHASQDTIEPLRSAFHFYDGKIELSAISKKNLDGADLAFLSACQTSTGDEKLSEEAVHLAAGMLAAGYRSVIATMWSIQDKHGPMIAENVYKCLLERGARDGGKGINGSDGAYALHYAVQEIRKKIGDSEESLLAWVPYVHFGF